MALPPRMFARARTRAESSLARAHVRRYRKKLRLAKFALPSYGSSPNLSLFGRDNDEIFIVSNEAAIFFLGAHRVADRARGNKVLRGVICPVEVEVIRNQRSLRGPEPWSPIHKLPTPVASMRSATNLLVEHDSRDGHSCVVARRQRMFIGHKTHSTIDRFLSYLTAIGVVARRRAKSLCPIGPSSGVEGLAALGAGAVFPGCSHAPSIPKE